MGAVVQTEMKLVALPEKVGRKYMYFPALVRKVALVD